MKHIAPVYFEDKIIYFYKSSKYKWLIDEVNLINLFKIDSKKLYEIKSNLEKNKHYIIEKIDIISNDNKKDIFLWSRKGVIKIAYLLNSESAFNIVDGLEDLQIKEPENEFKDIENILKKRLLNIQESESISELSSFVDIFFKFISEKESFKKKQNMGSKSMFLDIFEDILKNSKNK